VPDGATPRREADARRRRYVHRRRHADLGFGGLERPLDESDLRRGHRRWAIEGLGGAGLDLLGWVVAGGPAVLGLAVPEIWGSVVLSAWVLARARWPDRHG
jgi:hypothetical protein